ncbi:hypothetical protein [Taklimakanibacter lacteus]|uniref:hypothetical protein n=1 Tax=Taklimakanibacter lacteus TaxID=2268456 RepID=UPI0013C51176
MLHPIAIAGAVAVIVVGVALLALRTVGKRKGYGPQMAVEQPPSALWLTEKAAESRHEEHRDYLRERVKNDRHQDLD